MKICRDSVNPYITKDKSEIRELIHPEHHPVTNLSLAEARIQPGKSTEAHRHNETEEIYHVTAGSGEMTVNADKFPINKGDTILLKKGDVHSVTNTSADTLIIICACAPPYTHEDTDLVPNI